MKLTYLGSNASNEPNIIYNAGCARACVNANDLVDDAREYTGVSSKGNVSLILKCCAKDDCNDLKLISSGGKMFNYVLLLVFNIFFIFFSITVSNFLNKNL